MVRQVSIDFRNQSICKHSANQDAVYLEGHCCLLLLIVAGEACKNEQPSNILCKLTVPHHHQKTAVRISTILYGPALPLALLMCSLFQCMEASYATISYAALAGHAMSFVCCWSAKEMNTLGYGYSLQPIQGEWMRVEQLIMSQMHPWQRYCGWHHVCSRN